MPTISLTTELQPGKQRDIFLEAQMQKITSAINALYAADIQSVRYLYGNTNATVSDWWILVDATAASVVITLPFASTGSHALGVKKVDSTANTVTVQAIGSDAIDGAGTKVIAAQYENYLFVPGPSQSWSIF